MSPLCPDLVRRKCSVPQAQQIFVQAHHQLHQDAGGIPEGVKATHRAPLGRAAMKVACNTAASRSPSRLPHPKQAPCRPRGSGPQQRRGLRANPAGFAGSSGTHLVSMCGTHLVSMYTALTCFQCTGTHLVSMYWEMEGRFRMISFTRCVDSFSVRKVVPRLDRSRYAALELKNSSSRCRVTCIVTCRARAHAHRAKLVPQPGRSRCAVLKSRARCSQCCLSHAVAFLRTHTLACRPVHLPSR